MVYWIEDLRIDKRLACVIIGGQGLSVFAKNPELLFLFSKIIIPELLQKNSPSFFIDMLLISCISSTLADSLIDKMCDLHFKT